MKPSTRLQTGFRKAIADRAIMVGYSSQANAPGNVEPFTLEVMDHSDAYAVTVQIPALVDMMPAKAIRDKFGLETTAGSGSGVPSDAILLLIAMAEFEENGIVQKFGDKIVLPDDEKPWYVTRKPDYGQQVHGKHIGVQLICARKASYDDRSPNR